MLIDKLTSAPVLAFADPKLPYVLHTDACCEGLGAALYQEQGEKLRVIAYASRDLSKSEKNYPTHKLVYLALKWAICEKFNDYLYGTDFTVLTDNNPLNYLFDAAGHCCWLPCQHTDSTSNIEQDMLTGMQMVCLDGRRLHLMKMRTSYRRRRGLRQWQTAF